MRGVGAADAVVAGVGTVLSYRAPACGPIGAHARVIASGDSTGPPTHRDHLSALEHDMSSFKCEPFRLDVPAAVIDDLHTRLARTRWPDSVPGAGWSHGTDPQWLAALVEYWRNGYDWRAHEAQLNSLPQYRVALDGIDLHYVHVPAVGPAPRTLLLLNGWPSSFAEYRYILPMLTDPGRFGGDPADAFEVVVPSLPGYTLSFQPNQPRFGVEQIADTVCRLMVEHLGREKFFVHGSDWGAFVATRMAHVHARHVSAIHLTLLALRRDRTAFGQTMSDDEKRYSEELDHWIREETGYAHIQGTKPQTLAYGLTDSPVGLAAWIAEKFHRWTDHGGNLDSHIRRDDILTTVMLYWVTGAIGSSFWPYYARNHGPWIVPADQKVQVPTAYTQFPKEILRPPRSLAERMYGNIVRWSTREGGGHFPSFENPDVLAAELRDAFRPLRTV